MKKLITLVVLALAAGTPVAAENAWGPMVGYWDTEDGSDGYGLGVTLRLEVLQNVTFDLRYSWYRDLAEGNAQEGVADVDLQVMPIEAGLSLNLSPVDFLDLYGGGGIGYYLMDGDVDTEAGIEVDFSPDDQFGAYAVAGLALDISATLPERSLATGVSLFAEGMYRVVSVDEARTATGRNVLFDDGGLDGLTVNAGLLLLW